MSSLQCVTCRDVTVFAMYSYIDTTCHICLDTVSNVAIFACGHGVCRDCIKGLEKHHDAVYVPQRQLPIPPQQVTRFSTNEPRAANVRNLEAYVHFRGIHPQSMYDIETVEMDGQVYIWVKQSFSFYDWTLYDVATGDIAYTLSEPPPPHCDPRSAVSWTRRSKRWRSW